MPSSHDQAQDTLRRFAAALLARLNRMEHPGFKKPINLVVTRNINPYSVQMASSPCGHSVRKSLAMGPSVRNLLSHYQLDPKRITSTGPYHTLLKSDVLAYVNQHKLEPAKPNQEKGPLKKFVPNLDISGYQPKAGPEGFSKIAKDLLNM